MYDYVLGLYEKAFPPNVPLEEKLLRTKELGYDFMELCIDLDPEREARLQWSAAQRKELRSFMFDNGIHLRTLSLSALRRFPLGLVDEEANRQAFELLERGLELTCDLGAQILLLNGYDVYDGISTAETRARFGRNIATAAAYASRWGVVIGVENAEKAVMDSVSKVLSWVKAVDSPFLQIYGDIGNAANAAEGDADRALADLERGRGHLAAFHLKDTLPGEYRFTRYGQGHVDFARSIAKVKDLGVRIFTAELFYQPTFDPDAEAIRVCKFLRQWLDTPTF